MHNLQCIIPFNIVQLTNLNSQCNCLLFVMGIFVYLLYLVLIERSVRLRASQTSCCNRWMLFSRGHIFASSHLCLPSAFLIEMNSYKPIMINNSLFLVKRIFKLIVYMRKRCFLSSENICQGVYLCFYLDKSMKLTGFFSCTIICKYGIFFFAQRLDFVRDVERKRSEGKQRRVF